MNEDKPQTLWRWIYMRILLLSVTTVIAVAGCMFLRYALQNLWIIHHMPPLIRQEFLILREHPQVNLPRFHEIVDQYWGVRYSDPSVGAGDWIIVILLLLVTTPFVAFAVIRYAKPLALQFSHLKKTADRVSEGLFGSEADLINRAPSELVHFTRDFNRMSYQLAIYERELKASHVALAHELRSPLTAAIGRLQGMIDGVFESQPHQMNMIMKQLKHMSRLIDELHLLSLADAEQLRLDLSEMDIEELVNERVQWMKPQIQNSGISVDVISETALTCNIDSFRMGQVFTIIIENAVRYGKPGGRLVITSRRELDSCCIEFRDDGPGVAPPFLKSMFDRFTRADSSRARHSGGSGLGLSIARAICEAHGGKISAELPAGGGLAIKVFLPEGRV